MKSVLNSKMAPAQWGHFFGWSQPARTSQPKRMGSAVERLLAEHQRDPSRHGGRLPDILGACRSNPAFLAKISLFAPLDDDERAVLAQAMVDRQVKPGELLFRAGEPGERPNRRNWAKLLTDLHKKPGQLRDMLGGDAASRADDAFLADPKIKAQLELGGTMLAGSPTDFGKLIADETEKWAKVIKCAGIKPQ